MTGAYFFHNEYQNQLKFILSIKAAINTPAARKNTLIRQDMVEVQKLSKGIVIKVAATTLPSIERKVTE